MRRSPMPETAKESEEFLKPCSEKVKPAAILSSDSA